MAANETPISAHAVCRRIISSLRRGEDRNRAPHCCLRREMGEREWDLCYDAVRLYKDARRRRAASLARTRRGISGRRERRPDRPCIRHGKGTSAGGRGIAVPVAWPIFPKWYRGSLTLDRYFPRSRTRVFSRRQLSFAWFALSAGLTSFSGSSRRLGRRSPLPLFRRSSIAARRGRRFPLADSVQRATF